MNLLQTPKDKELLKEKIYNFNSIVNNERIKLKNQVNQFINNQNSKREFPNFKENLSDGSSMNLEKAKVLLMDLLPKLTDDDYFVDKTDSLVYTYLMNDKKDIKKRLDAIELPKINKIVSKSQIKNREIEKPSINSNSPFSIFDEPKENSKISNSTEKTNSVPMSQNTQNLYERQNTQHLNESNVITQEKTSNLNEQQKTLNLNEPQKVPNLSELQDKLKIKNSNPEVQKKVNNTEIEQNFKNFSQLENKFNNTQPEKEQILKNFPLDQLEKDPKFDTNPQSRKNLTDPLNSYLNDLTNPIPIVSKIDKPQSKSVMSIFDDPEVNSDLDDIQQKPKIYPKEVNPGNLTFIKDNEHIDPISILNENNNTHKALNKDFFSPTTTQYYNDAIKNENNITKFEDNQTLQIKEITKNPNDCIKKKSEPIKLIDEDFILEKHDQLPLVSTNAQKIFDVIGNPNLNTTGNSIEDNTIRENSILNQPKEQSLNDHQPLKESLFDLPIDNEDLLTNRGNPNCLNNTILIKENTNINNTILQESISVDDESPKVENPNNEVPSDYLDGKLPHTPSDQPQMNQPNISTETPQPNQPNNLPNPPEINHPLKQIDTLVDNYIIQETLNPDDDRNKQFAKVQHSLKNLISDSEKIKNMLVQYYLKRQKMKHQKLKKNIPPLFSLEEKKKCLNLKKRDTKLIKKIYENNKDEDKVQSFLETKQYVKKPIILVKPIIPKKQEYHPSSRILVAKRKINYPHYGNIGEQVIYGSIPNYK